MDKRYQVFVSSTFTDLKEERKHVIQTLMEMDCIPAGMELFPAIDEEQWEFIKKIIDDCDYYLLIIGGRYGSVAEDGLSYTEKEFDYAIEKGLKVTVLTHESPDSLPVNKSEINPESREKLTAFITKATTGRLRRTWSSEKELPGLVALSMTKTIKTYPAVGWVRADKITNESALEELNELRKENLKIQKELDDNKNKNLPSIPKNIAGLDKEFTINFELISNDIMRFQRYNSTITKKLSDIFNFISPIIYKTCNDSDVVDKINELIKKNTNSDGLSAYVDDDDYQVISLQLLALGLVEINAGKWNLTTEGINKMMDLKLVRD
ncbi:DUF4062 domain-containing protein [Erwinia rhapontici]|uniref:DUF4062 domain-containing protein n=1 Tax=Erwinia rhapontici TaxID=55212 RepID=UPI0014386532|nr:DUF4062 domain-containing protein [Erwinia rhapontici]NKG29668.1 DUF4062 domain-containing protein [Erwinia rhapontici]